MGDQGCRRIRLHGVLLGSRVTRRLLQRFVALRHPLPSSVSLGSSSTRQLSRLSRRPPEPLHLLRYPDRHFPQDHSQRSRAFPSFSPPNASSLLLLASLFTQHPPTRKPYLANHLPPLRPLRSLRPTFLLQSTIDFSHSAQARLLGLSPRSPLRISFRTSQHHPPSPQERRSQFGRRRGSDHPSPSVGE